MTFALPPISKAIQHHPWQTITIGFTTMPCSPQARRGNALGVGAVVVACRIAEDVVVVCHSGGKAVAARRQGRNEVNQLCSCQDRRLKIWHAIFPEV